MNKQLGYKEAKETLQSLMKDPAIKAQVRAEGNWTHFTTSKLNETICKVSPCKCTGKANTKLNRGPIKRTITQKVGSYRTTDPIQQAIDYFLRGSDILRGYLK